MNRPTTTRRVVSAGCLVCKGDDAMWTHTGAQGTAARHHDRTGHATWCDVALEVRYGAIARDARQVDLEDAIAATADPKTGRRPEATTRPPLEAPATVTADVSAHEGRPSRRAAPAGQRGARGRQPETASS